MTRFELLKQIDISLASEIIFDLSRKLDSAEKLKNHLCGDVSEAELQQINDAARREGRHLLSFSFKQ